MIKYVIKIGEKYGLFKLTSICLGLLILNGCTTDPYAPTIRYYHGTPSCMLGCYSHNPQGIYKLSSGPYLEGGIWIHGKYDNHICKPIGYETTDIDKIPEFKDLCNKLLKSCENTKKTTGKGCWADADTGNLTAMPIQ